MFLKEKGSRKRNKSAVVKEKLTLLTVYQKLKKKKKDRKNRFKKNVCLYIFLYLKCFYLYVCMHVLCFYCHNISIYFPFYNLWPLWPLL